MQQANQKLFGILQLKIIHSILPRPSRNLTVKVLRISPSLSRLLVDCAYVTDSLLNTHMWRKNHFHCERHNILLLSTWFQAKCVRLERYKIRLCILLSPWFATIQLTTQFIFTNFTSRNSSSRALQYNYGGTDTKFDMRFCCKCSKDIDKSFKIRIWLQLLWKIVSES